MAAETKYPKKGTIIRLEDNAHLAFNVKDEETHGHIKAFCERVGLKITETFDHSFVSVEGLGGLVRQVAETWAKNQLDFFEDPHVWCDRVWTYDRLLTVPRPLTEEAENAQKALVDYHCRLMGNNYWWMSLDYARYQDWETKWVQQKDNPRGGYISHYHHGCGGRIVELKTDYVCTLGCSKCKEEWSI